MFISSFLPLLIFVSVRPTMSLLSMPKYGSAFVCESMCVYLPTCMWICLCICVLVGVYVSLSVSQRRQSALKTVWVVGPKSSTTGGAMHTIYGIIQGMFI